MSPFMRGTQAAPDSGRDKVVIYLDTENRYRWRYVAGNGEVMADSGQAYARKADAIAGAKQVTGRRFRTTPIEGA